MDSIADMLASLPESQKKQFRDYCNHILQKLLAKKRREKANIINQLEAGIGESEVSFEAENDR